MVDLLAVLAVLWLVGMLLAGIGLGGLHVIVHIDRAVRATTARLKATSRSR